MKFADFTIQLDASHSKIEQHERREPLVAWQQNGKRKEISEQQARGKDLQALAVSMQEKSTKVSLSSATRRNMPVKTVVQPIKEKRHAHGQLEHAHLECMFEKFTSHKILLSDPDQLKQGIEAAAGQQDTPLSPRLNLSHQLKVKRLYQWGGVLADMVYRQYW